MIKDAARDYLDAGLCVLPARRDQKRPTVAWKPFQSRRPTAAELSAWMDAGADAICILCGRTSGNVETIDFDAGGELFDAWWQRLDPALRARLVIERTPSGGFHAIYRCVSAICGNLKLAQRKTDDGVATLIETRGEGGLFLCAPTDGYELTQGDLAELPTLSDAERDALLSAAWALNEYTSPAESSGPQSAHTGEPRGHKAQTGHTGHNGQKGRPGDDFNATGDVRSLLESHGWMPVSDRPGAGGYQYWRRPGKDARQKGWSATLSDNGLYVFSSNAAPFEPDTLYSPMAIYALLEHGGDFQRAARALREAGYGDDPFDPRADDDVDISALVQRAAQLADNTDPGPPVEPLASLIENFDGLNRPVIHRLLREGETMNVIASPKMGKSWFVSSLAISVASGLDWLDHPVEPGRVLHIDNELHACTSAYRYGVISEAMGVDHRLYSANIDMVSLRGHLRDLYSMAALFDRIKAGEYKLVIIDAFYRTLPRDTDENDNGAIANLYNLIDHYASQLKCAFVLIHHSSKGNQAGKSITDVGAGAGSQSRAADTHLILRPHEEPGIVVLESAVRSWPPAEPMALRWDWPLFTPVDGVDTSALLGAAKPKEKPKDVPVDQFVELCVGRHDPCSKRSVRYEARQHYGLSERKADETLELAMEREDVARIRCGSHMRYVKTRPGAAGDKALWTAAILAHQPDANAQQVAETVGATRQYVNQIRRSIGGNSVETRGN